MKRCLCGGGGGANVGRRRSQCWEEEPAKNYLKGSSI